MALVIFDESLGEHNSAERQALAGAAGAAGTYLAAYRIYVGDLYSERSAASMKLLNFINENLMGVVYIWTRDKSFLTVMLSNDTDVFTMDMSKAGMNLVYKSVPCEIPPAGFYEIAWEPYEAL